jgi:hypothetical protein
MEKPENEKGKFIHPELFGHPATDSIEAVHRNGRPVLTPVERQH